MSTFCSPVRLMVSNPAATTTAPINPPMRAWEVLDGQPKYQVIRFHTMAPLNAAMMTALLIAAGSTTSLPMVVATATPKRNGPTNSAIAVMPRAARGAMARDEIMVATMLLESCIPFRKSNIKAMAMMTINREGIPSLLLPLAHPQDFGNLGRRPDCRAGGIHDQVAHLHLRPVALLDHQELASEVPVAKVGGFVLLAIIDVAFPFPFHPNGIVGQIHHRASPGRFLVLCSAHRTL